MACFSGLLESIYTTRRLIQPNLQASNLIASQGSKIIAAKIREPQGVPILDPSILRVLIYRVEAWQVLHTLQERQLLQLLIRSMMVNVSPSKWQSSWYQTIHHQLVFPNSSWSNVHSIWLLSTLPLLPANEPICSAIFRYIPVTLAT